MWLLYSITDGRLLVNSIHVPMLNGEKIYIKRSLGNGCVKMSANLEREKERERDRLGDLMKGVHREGDRQRKETALNVCGS